MYREFINKQKQPLLIVISGPSGVGKDTVLQHMKELKLPFHFVVTATSRPKREGEVEGVDYFFVSPDEFLGMVERDELLEHALVYNEYKGIPRRQVQDAFASGRDVVMRLDVQGAETIRQLYPEALLIFLSTQTEEELIARLKARRTESKEMLQLRIDTAREELYKVDLFDYYVVNADGQLDETVDAIVAIIASEHRRSNPRRVRL
ncbi:MAG: guanylate kinase [Anaerolineales bacterium]|nr:guanylate kinase [Anaerolineales bacterium]MCK5634451.1 guanylate kinase [Anaerolineales bacterium]